MAFTIVFGLAILSVANYGNTFEFSGLDPSQQSKFKSTPFSPLNIKPRFGEQVKPAFGLGTKPFGSFEPFKQSYQQYQPGPFRTNYQPFGPFPGYPGPVVYPGQIPSVYPQSPYRIDDPNAKPFGFQPFLPSAAVHKTFELDKVRSAEKFNKFPNFNHPGKYFQEHKFGAYHGPEFSFATVPAEHNIKQSKPKDSLLGKPVIPSFPALGLQEQLAFRFAPQPIFNHPTHQPIQPFSSRFQPSVKDVQSVNSILPNIVPGNNFRFGSTATAAVTTATAPSSSSEESATARASEVTTEPLATPAADPQPTSPSQEEVTAGGPSTVEQSQKFNPSTEGTEPSADEQPATQVINSAEPISAVTEEQVQEDKPAAQEANSQLAGSSPVVVEPVPEISSPVNDAIESSTVSDSENSTVNGSDNITDSKSEEAVTENLTENKPTESGANVNLPGLPNEFYGTLPPSSDPSTLGLFASSGIPYFGQSVGFQQPQYLPYYDAPKLSDEELKLFAANFGSDALTFQSPTQVVGGENAAVKNTESASAKPAVSTESSVPVSSTPLAENVEKVESVEKVENSEKKESTGGESASRDVPEAPKKSNTVEILQDDPFNGQLPLLFDPSNTASPLDTFKFYSHPSVSALSSQASLATYSPEDAFSNFGSQFRQGYLVEGSPSLTPITKTILQSSQTPISISSKDHPLHSQVFKYSQSFVPYPALVTGNNAAVFRSVNVPSSNVAATQPLADATIVPVTNAVVSSTTETAAVSDSATTTVAA